MQPFARLPLGEVLEFLRILWALDHQLEVTSRRMESTIGITAQQRFVVRLLGRFHGMTAGQIAEVLAVHPSVVSGLLRRLADRGLIVRRRDARDLRRHFLGLTEAGRRVNADATGTVEGAVRRVFQDMSRGKVTVATEVLAALTAALEAGRDGQPETPRRAIP
jgi:DNA-binding MarR family transcriptional regulator